MLREYDSVQAGQTRLSEVVTGFHDPEAEAAALVAAIAEKEREAKEKEREREREKAREENPDDFEDEDDADDDDDDTTTTRGKNDDDDDDAAPVDTGPNPEEAAKHFAELQRLYKKVTSARNKHGAEAAAAQKARDELRDAFLLLKLTPRVVEMITTNLRDQIERIVDIQLAILRRRLADRGLSIELTDLAVKQLASEGWDPAFGARPLKRAKTRSSGTPSNSSEATASFRTLLTWLRTTCRSRCARSRCSPI